MTWLTWISEIQGKLYLESIGICSLHQHPNIECKTCITMWTCDNCKKVDFDDVKIPTELECTVCVA